MQKTNLDGSGYIKCQTTHNQSERVQALADISRSALCCHSSETRASIANPLNSAQLDGTPTIPRLHPGPRSSVGMWRGTDTRLMHISPRLCFMQNVTRH